MQSLAVSRGNKIRMNITQGEKGGVKEGEEYPPMSEEISISTDMISVRSRRESEISTASTGSRSSKRKKVEADDEVDITVEYKDLEKARIALEGIRAMVKEAYTVGGRMKKDIVNCIEEQIRTLDNCLTRTALRNAALKGKLEATDARDNKQTYSSVLVNQPAKARIPAVKGQAGRKTVPIKRHCVLIKPTEGKDLGGTTVRDLVVKAINPVKERMHINSLKKLRDGTVALEVPTRSDLDKVTNNVQLKEAGLKVTIPTIRRPRIIVYDMPSDLDEDRGKEAIYEQNIDVFEDLTKADFLDQAKLVFKTGRRDGPEANWIMEVTSTVRNKLRTTEKLYILTRRCKILDYVALSRCFNCQRYGHIAKYCKNAKPTCAHCAEEGHTIKECRKTTKAQKCAACRAVGRPHDHKADKNCPTYLLALEAYKGTVDYG